MEYYGNNDWRDYKYLKHYGVKGMKWGKRKNKYTIETQSTSNYQGVHLNKNGKEVASIGVIDYKGVGPWTHKTYSISKEGKFKDKYVEKNIGTKNMYLYYMNEYGSKSVGLYLDSDKVKKTLKSKIKKVSTSVKNKVNSFISKFSKKKVKKRK